MQFQQFKEKINENENAKNFLGYMYAIKKRVANGVLGEQENPITHKVEPICKSEDIKDYIRIMQSSSNKELFDLLNYKDMFDLAKTYSMLYGDLYNNERELPEDNLKESIDEKKLTDELIEILSRKNRKAFELLDANKKEIIKARADELVQQIVGLIRPYYETTPPTGVMFGDIIYTTRCIDENNSVYCWYKGEMLSSDVKGNKRKIITQKPLQQCIVSKFEEFNVKKEQRSDEGNIINYENIEEKGITYFPRFQLALATGVKGLYRPLTEYIMKNGGSLSEGNRITSVEEMRQFLQSYIPNLLAEIFTENDKGFILNEGEGYVEINEELYKKVRRALLSAVVVIEYIEGLAIKVRITAENMKDKITEQTLQSWAKTTQTEYAKDLSIISDYFTNMCFLKQGTDGSSALDTYQALPMWAYQVASLIKKKDKPSWGAVPMGKNKKDEIVTASFKGKTSWAIPLIAGSRSGKGVATLTFLAQAQALEYPIMYLDCKPDMAKSFYNWAKEHANTNVCVLDGNDNSEMPFYIKGEREIDYCERMFKEYIGERAFNSIPQGERVLIYNTIAWVRCLEIMRDVIYVRRRDGSKFIKDETTERDFVTNKDIRPIFVLDEVQAESINIANLFETDIELSVEKQDSKGNGTGKFETVKSKGTFGKLILEANKVGDIVSQKALTNIQKWVQGVLGGGITGLAGQTKTAFAGQANVNMFLIGQDVPNTDVKKGECPKYGALLGNLVKAYMKNTTTRLYGRGSDAGEGSQSYGLKDKVIIEGIRKTYGDKANPEVGLGKFVLKNDAKVENISTYFVLNGAFDKNYMPLDPLLDTIDNLASAGAGAKNKTFKDVWGDNVNEENYRTTPVKELRVDYKYYITYLMSKEDEEGEVKLDINKFYKTLNVGYEYFNRFCKLIYNEDLYERIFNMSDFVVETADIKYENKNNKDNETRMLINEKAIQLYCEAKGITLEEYNAMFEDTGDVGDKELTNEEIAKAEAEAEKFEQEFSKYLEEARQIVENEKNENEMQPNNVEYFNDNKVWDGEKEENDNNKPVNVNNEEPLSNGDMVIDGFGGEEEPQGTQYDLEDTNKRYDKLVEDIESENEDEDDTYSRDISGEDEAVDEENVEVEDSYKNYSEPAQPVNRGVVRNEMPQRSIRPEGTRSNNVFTTKQGNTNNEISLDKSGRRVLGQSANGLMEATATKGISIKPKEYVGIRRLLGKRNIDVDDIGKIEKIFMKSLVQSSGFKLNQIQLLVLNGDVITINNNKMQLPNVFGYGEEIHDMFDFKSPYFRELSQLRKIGMDEDYMWRYANQWGIPQDTMSIAKDLFARFKNLKSIVTPDGRPITRKDILNNMTQEFETDKDMKEKSIRNEVNAMFEESYKDETSKKKTLAEMQRAEYKNLSRAEQKLVRKRAVPVAIAKGIIWGVKTPFRLVGWLGRRIFGR